VLPEFGLRIYQQPGGGDIAAAAEAITQRNDGEGHGQVRA